MVEHTLADGETIVVDTPSLIGWQETTKVSYKMAGDCLTICCGGQGLVNTTVTGPGKILLQSMSFESYRQALRPPPQMPRNQGGTSNQVGGGAPPTQEMER